MIALPASEHPTYAEFKKYIRKLRRSQERLDDSEYLMLAHIACHVAEAEPEQSEALAIFMTSLWLDNYDWLHSPTSHKVGDLFADLEHPPSLEADRQGWARVAQLARFGEAAA